MREEGKTAFFDKKEPDKLLNDERVWLLQKFESFKTLFLSFSLLFAFSFFFFIVDGACCYNGDVSVTYS